MAWNEVKGDLINFDFVASINIEHYSNKVISFYTVEGERLASITYDTEVACKECYERYKKLLCYKIAERDVFKKPVNTVVHNVYKSDFFIHEVNDFPLPPEITCSGSDAPVTGGGNKKEYVTKVPVT